MAVERWSGYLLTEVVDGGGNVISRNLDIAELLITVPDGGGTISYMIDFPGNPNSSVTINTDATGFDFLVNGVSQGFDPNTTDAFLDEVTWTDAESGQTFTAQVLSLEFPNGTYAVFQVGGDLIPPFASYADFSTFNNLITPGPITDPALQPGSIIAIADLPNTQTTHPGTTGVDITANPAGETVVGGTGDDTLTGGGSNDRLDGGDGEDSIVGGAGNDQILGRIGADRIYGGDGDDTISASDGDDLVYGGNGNDSIGGGLGADMVSGGEGHDIIGGGNQNDWLEGNNGNDTVSGGRGNDSVFGGVGDDQMAGGGDVDIVDGGDGNDNMGGGNGNDTMYGGAGDDLMGAGNHDDFLYGGSGNDFMGGGAGNDQLFGGDGIDRLNGGTGDDTMTGGAGADRFIFNSFVNGERDVIADFEDGIDRIQLKGISGATGADRFAQLTITDTFAGAVVAINGHEILVEGVAAANLTLSDFIFV